MEDDDLSGAPFFIQGGSRDESHRFGLDQICNLSVGKKCLTNSMRLYTARSSDSGLRPPSLKEAPEC